MLIVHPHTVSVKSIFLKKATKNPPVSNPSSGGFRQYDAYGLFRASHSPGIIVLSFCNHLHFAVCSIFLSSIYLLICPHTHIIFPVLFSFLRTTLIFPVLIFFCFCGIFCYPMTDLIAICLFHFLERDFRFCCTGSHCLKFFRCCQFFDFWRIWL